MDQIYPNEGLANLMVGLIAGGMRWHLYTNDYTPDRTSLYGDFTEVAAPGYVPVDRDRFDPINGQVLNDRGMASTTPAAFFQTSGGGVQVYGYFVSDTVGNLIVLAAARFDAAPLTMVPNELFLVPCVLTDHSFLP